MIAMMLDRGSPMTCDVMEVREKLGAASKTEFSLFLITV